MRSLHQSPLLPFSCSRKTHPSSPVTISELAWLCGANPRPTYPPKSGRHRKKAIPPPSQQQTQCRFQSARRTPTQLPPAIHIREARIKLPRPGRHSHQNWRSRTPGASTVPWHIDSLHGYARSSHKKDAYADVAVECWQQFTGANAVLAVSGETFADLKAKRLAA